MNIDSFLKPQMLLAALLVLAPVLFAAFAPERFRTLTRKLPRPLRILLPVLLCLPYFIVTRTYGDMRWGWLVVYALIPVAIAWLMDESRQADGRMRGNWRDYAVQIGRAHV